MSAAATANMTETRTGTIQSNLTTIVVSSASNLAKGMQISGPGIKAGTTITGIAGTTLTLSQAADVNYTLAGTKNGALGATTSGNAVQLPDLDGIYLTSPMWVTGPGLPSGVYTEVTAWRSQFGPYPFLALVNYAGAGSGTYSFYYGAAYSSATYSFTASPIYTFRSPNVIGLPYGGFPGIGVYGS
jgi:hypothetical protein